MKVKKMLVSLVLAPVLAAQRYGDPDYFAHKDVAPEDRTMTVSPFDIEAIIPVEYYASSTYAGNLTGQSPQARSVVVVRSADCIGTKVFPVITAPSILNEMWNRALREYAAAAPKEVLRVRAKAGLEGEE